MEIAYSDLINNHNLELIDIRESNLYQKKHFQEAQNISYTKLLINPEKYLDKKKGYLLICEYGLKSKKMSIILNNMGYKTYSLIGGMQNYFK